MAHAGLFVCQPVGEAGVLVTATATGWEQRWLTVHGLAAQLRAHPLVGLEDVVATFDTVLVSFDPELTDCPTVTAAVQASQPPPWQPRLRQFEVPARYGLLEDPHPPGSPSQQAGITADPDGHDSDGPDLAWVARSWGWQQQQLVDWHTGRPWLIRAIGSPLGAPLLEPLPAAYAAAIGWRGTHPDLPPVPRLESPRPRVRPGAIGLAGGQSIIYNGASPGGWQLIATTPLQLFTPPLPTAGLADQPPSTAFTPIPYQPGDVVWFRAIDAAEFVQLRGRPLSGPRP